jgi:hypothetical protein
MIRSVLKLKPISMMAAVAFLGPHGRAHELSDPQMQTCTGYHSLLVPPASITTDHQASLRTYSQDLLNRHCSHSLRILFL